MSEHDELNLERHREHMEELREEWIQYGKRQANAALLAALEELVESHDALLNPASNRGEPAIGSALVDRLGAAWKGAHAAIKDARKE